MGDPSNCWNDKECNCEECVEQLRTTVAEQQQRIEELGKQNRQLKEALIGWRTRAWPGTDQRAVIEKDFPELLK